MGEVGMAWRVVYRLAGTKYPRACRQKNDEGGGEGDGKSET